MKKFDFSWNVFASRIHDWCRLTKNQPNHKKDHLGLTHTHGYHRGKKLHSFLSMFVKVSFTFPMDYLDPYDIKGIHTSSVVGNFRARKDLLNIWRNLC